MNDVTTQKRLMLRYLFGDVSAEERAAFEETYLGDSEVFQELVTLENEIIDQYILGELPDSERESLERSFLGDPVRRDSVMIARSLLAYSASVENLTPTTEPKMSSGWLTRAVLKNRARTMQFAAAIAFVVTTSALLWLLIANRKMAHEIEAFQAQQIGFLQTTRALQQQMERLQAKLEHDTDTEHSGVKPTAKPRTISLTLASGLVRGANKPVNLVIPGDAAWVLFHIVVGQDTHSQYSVSIVDEQGDSVWRGTHVQSLTSGAGKEIRLRLPAHLFSSGNYVLRTTTGSESVLDEMTGYTFHVMKR